LRSTTTVAAAVLRILNICTTSQLYNCKSHQPLLRLKPMTRAHSKRLIRYYRDENSQQLQLYLQY